MVSLVSYFINNAGKGIVRCKNFEWFAPGPMETPLTRAHGGGFAESPDCLLNGVVSDQYTDYDYHWTDGSGRFVHTDDPNLDPNKYLNGNYEQMAPQR